MRKLILLICQFLLAVSFIYSQSKFESIEKYNFAYVNFYFFDNKDKGIIQLTKAYDAVDNSCCFSSCSQEIVKKQEKILVEPVKNKINYLLSEIEKQNNLKILRMDDLDRISSVLAVNIKFDLTEKFITFYNSQPNQQKVFSDFTVPKSKIGVVNTKLFFDKLKGIKSFAEFNENNNSEYICGKTSLCQELGKAIQTFAEKNEFGIILDSSKELPLELKDLKTIDITKEFISEYNNSNK
ncbi:hypothetical protein BH20ACI4_BH20ACI4_21890 [soil metagenome]